MTNVDKKIHKYGTLPRSLGIFSDGAHVDTIESRHLVHLCHSSVYYFGCMLTSLRGSMAPLDDETVQYSLLIHQLNKL